VRYCTKIEHGAKLLYGEITALSNLHGYSWASNKYFMDAYGISESTVKNWLKSLKDEGFIEVILEKKGFVTHRKISIINNWNNPSIKNNSTTCRNRHPRETENDIHDVSKSDCIIAQGINSTLEQNTDDDLTTRGVVDEKEKKKKTTKLDYRSKYHGIRTITDTEIYRYFLGLEKSEKIKYPTEIIEASIAIVCDKNPEVNDILRYLRSVCDSLMKEQKPAKYPEKEIPKNTQNDIPIKDCPKRQKSAFDLIALVKGRAFAEEHAKQQGWTCE
jgi:DNA-binding transcriptional ArsR family regulator